MRSLLFATVSVYLLAVSLALAQDPVKVDPKHATPQIENNVGQTQTKGADASKQPSGQLIPRDARATTEIRQSRDYIDIVLRISTLALGLIVGVFTIRWGVRNWRLTFFTKEWSNLVQFLQSCPKYMDPSKTRIYSSAFTGDDAIAYEMVARLCIAYLDDLYFIGSKKEMRTWFRGSINSFAGRHRAWLEDNKNDYDTKFYEFIIQQLDGGIQQAKQQPPTDGAPRPQ